LGLYNYFKEAGIESTVITPTDYADFLWWLPGNDKVLIFEGNEEEANRIIANSELVYCLDFNALGRINEMGKSITDSNAKVILIDHHRDPQDFDDERLCSIGASSTCELMYYYISKHLNVEFMTKDAAECIYTGLITDTGSFRYNSTTGDTIRTAGALIDLGVQPSSLYERLFDQNRLERLQLLGYFLSKKITLIENGKVALSHLTIKELEDFNVKTGDTEGFVNYGLGIKGVEMSALIIDRGSLVKMSFRSKSDFPCNEFSAEFFNGGGHKNAAGGASKESLVETLYKFKSAIKSYSEYL
ncbi:MAG: DHH family phosphoesterase, partial [Bacteroidia bacterium]|nr:DHH family phosphoesterase [Bacteroidia bacterium]